VKQVRVEESGLPGAPLITCIELTNHDARSDLSGFVTAHAVAVSARASLAAQRSDNDARSLVADVPFPGAMDANAWEAWISHRQGKGRGSDSQSISFDLASVSYVLPNKRKLLQDLSFVVPAGMSVAIMGASGSGKTTLLSVLSGRCGDGRFAGKMLLNDTPVSASQMTELRPLIGYVPQDDVMHTSLTVRENIKYQGELRDSSFLAGRFKTRDSAQSSSSDDGGEMDDRVASVISGLGLSAVQNHQIRDGLSGGQRKRVSIGMELVSKPRVLLLDEPSSGLDSSTAHRILELVLRHSNAEVCTSFASIHQPRWSTLSLFGMLVLMAPGGHLCFAGPVSAVKAYFMEVLHVDFPEDENPADIMLDICTFDSARKMALDGVWKNPPQCLRAVLIPTPVAVQEEEHRAAWQQDEFGRMLAALWNDFKAVHERAMAAPKRTGARASEVDMCLVPGQQRPDAFHRVPDSSPGNRLAVEAAAKAEAIHWAQQVWMHISRALLLMSRNLGTLAMNVFMLMFSLRLLSWVFVGDSAGVEMTYCFLRSLFMFLVIVLAQSVAAQHVFGGEERSVAWREASVCSLPQTLFSFIGQDLASLVEISFSALCFTLLYWPISGTLVSCGALFEIMFATLYAVWGLSHIWAVAFTSHIAMLTAVVIAFLSFLCSGMKPDLLTMANLADGYGSLLLLASPVRWGMSRWIYAQVTGVGSTFLVPSVKEAIAGHWNDRNYNLDHLEGMTCADSRSLGNVLTRWRDNRGWSCHSGQLFLLGFLFRFVAAVCFIMMSSARSSGGDLPFGLSSTLKSRVLHNCIVILVISMTVLNIRILGETY